jgi:hypothetical protein
VRLASPRGYQRKSAADCTVSGEEFQQPGGQYREEEGKRKERGARGFIGEALMANYLCEIKGEGVTPAAVSKTVSGGEICGRRKMALTSGTRLAEREGRGSGVALVRGELGRLAPGCGPSGLLASSFYFYFLSVFFFFCFRFLFWVFEIANLF